LSNNKVELLDRCMTKLERNDHPRLARRTLERYKTEKRSEAKGWCSWLEVNRDRLFFTEAVGYKFQGEPRTLLGRRKGSP
jgi:hypothetical protein